jgi:hypothetical protein
MHFWRALIEVGDLEGGREWTILERGSKHLRSLSRIRPWS